MTLKELLILIESSIMGGVGWTGEISSDSILPLRDELREAVHVMDLVNSPATHGTFATERTADEMNPPALLVLPSGRPFRFDKVLDVLPHTSKYDAPESLPRCAVRFEYETGNVLSIYDATDAAAIKSAILRFGVQVEAATLKGSDADGDGVTGE